MKLFTICLCLSALFAGCKGTAVDCGAEELNQLQETCLSFGGSFQGTGSIEGLVDCGASQSSGQCKIQGGGSCTAICNLPKENTDTSSYTNTEDSSNDTKQSGNGFGDCTDPAHCITELDEVDCTHVLQGSDATTYSSVSLIPIQNALQSGHWWMSDQFTTNDDDGGTALQHFACSRWMSNGEWVAESGGRLERNGSHIDLYIECPITFYEVDTLSVIIGVVKANGTLQRVQIGGIDRVLTYIVDGDECVRNFVDSIVSPQMLGFVSITV